MWNVSPGSLLEDVWIVEIDIAAIATTKCTEKVSIKKLENSAVGGIHTWYCVESYVVC